MSDENGGHDQGWTGSEFPPPPPAGPPVGPPPGSWPPPAPAAGQGPQPPGQPFGGSYTGPPTAPDFDDLTRKAGGLRSRRSMLRLGAGAIVAAVVAWFVWGRRGDSPGCPTASRCDDKRYCNEEETCLCTETTEGDNRCGQVPPFCQLPLCTSSADCAHLGDGWFCDAPNSGCCTDPPAELSRCIAPCGTEYPNEVMTTTTTTAPAEEPTETTEPDVEDDEPSHLRRTATQPDGLLFFSIREDGSSTYFYGQEDGSGSLQPTHVVFENADGTTATIIVNEDLLPISWTAGTLSIAARPETRDVDLDPSDALHSVIVEAQEHVLRVDLVPTDVVRVLASAEQLTGERFPDARRAFRELSEDWSDVVTDAGDDGDLQPQRIANALAASIAHAAIAILEQAEEVELDGGAAPSSGDSGDSGNDITTTTTSEDGPAGLRSPTAAAPPVVAQITPIYKLLSELLGPLLESLVKNALISAAAEEFVGGPQAPTDPDAPAFDLLLCQGATKWGTVCHYTFFDQSNIDGCLDFCKTDLSCFTNICMPITLSVEDALQTW